MVKSNEINKFNITKTQLNTDMLKETLMNYGSHLKNKGNSKGIIKKLINSVINDLVEDKILFEGFTVAKDLMVYVDHMFKEKNLKESLNVLLHETYGIAPANIVNEFLSNKYIAKNSKLQSYIEQNS